MEHKHNVKAIPREEQVSDKQDHVELHCVDCNLRLCIHLSTFPITSRVFFIPYDSTKPSIYKKEAGRMWQDIMIYQTKCIKYFDIINIISMEEALR